MKVAVGVRAVPLAVLLAVALAAGTVRLRRRPTRPAPGAHSAHAAELPAPLASGPSIGASLPAVPARISEHAARMIHGDTHHTHRAKGHGPRTAKLAWTLDTGGPVEAQVTVAPDEQTLYAASLGGDLVAFGRDGAKRWSTPLGDRGYATPCVADDGVIYVGSDAHKLYAVAPDGHVKWALETDADADTGPAIGSDGNVVFAAGAAVYAVRPRGDVAWRFATPRKVFASPAFTDDGLVVFGAQDHRAYGLKPSGTLAWSTDLGSDVDGAPSLGDDGSAFFGTDAGEIVRMDPAAGTVVWRTAVGGPVRGALSVARNGDVLAGVYGPTPKVVRVAPDGTLRGSLPLPGSGARELGAHGGPLEDDSGWLFFGAQDDHVYAVDETGRVQWQYQTGGDVDSPVTLLSDGLLIAGSDDGKVYAFTP